MSQAAGLPGIDQPVNLMISNVAGPSTPVYLAGARQRAQFPIAEVKDGLGLNIMVFSYQDSLEIGIVVDREQGRRPVAQSSAPCGPVCASSATWSTSTLRTPTTNNQ